MAECEYISTCPFPQGNMQDRDYDLDAMMDEYCRANNLHCARYMVSMALGETEVPADLYPDEKTRAYQLIATSG